MMRRRGVKKEKRELRGEKEGQERMKNQRKIEEVKLRKRLRKEK